MARYEAEQTIHLSLLKRQMIEKKRLITQVRSTRHLDPVSAHTIRTYWDQVSKIIQGLEQVGTAKEFVADVQHDIDSLRLLRSTLETRRDKPKTENELELVHSLLAVLLVVLGTVKKRAKELSDARFAWLFSVNPAKPKKDPWWKKKDDKNKKGPRKAPRLRELFRGKEETAESTQSSRQEGGADKKKEDKSER